MQKAEEATVTIVSGVRHRRIQQYAAFYVNGGLGIHQIKSVKYLSNSYSLSQEAKKFFKTQVLKSY